MNLVEKRLIKKATQSVRDELDLALVVSGLKRGAVITMRNEDAIKRLPVGYATGLMRQIGVSADEETVALFKKAFEKRGAKRHSELGTLLGYPKDAIDKYVLDSQNSQHLMFRDFQMNMAIAVVMGTPVPSFMAYISHVPAKSDFANGVISESSAALGLEYQKYIQKNHPKLATRVEKHFYKGLEKMVQPPTWTGSRASVFTRLRRRIESALQQQTV